MGVAKAAQFDPKLAIRETSSLFNDFYYYSSGSDFTTLTTNSGTVAQSTTDSLSNIGCDNLLFTSGTTAGNYIGINSTNACMPIQANQNSYFETYVNWTSQASNNAAIVAGLASASPVNTTQTAVPTASYSGALLIKLGGATVWSTQSSNATTKTNHTTNQIGSDGYYVLGINIQNWDSTDALVTYFVNGIQCTDSTTGLLIADKLSYTSLAATKLYIYGQSGSNNAQLIYCDYVAYGKYRGLLNPAFN